MVLHSSFRTLEALAQAITKHIGSLNIALIQPMDAANVAVTIRKPAALALAIPSVSVVRSLRSGTSCTPVPSNGDTGHSRQQRDTKASFSFGRSSNTPGTRIFIALGSNIAPCVQNISREQPMTGKLGVAAREHQLPTSQVMQLVRISVDRKAPSELIGEGCVQGSGQRSDASTVPAQTRAMPSLARAAAGRGSSVAKQRQATEGPGIPDGMPRFSGDFWRVYGNRLRVFGTEEGVCALADGN